MFIYLAARYNLDLLMTELHKNRIFWQSRRGMLELDLLLEPFARNRFETLNLQQQWTYHEFLKNEDQDLYAWLMERTEPPEKSFQEIIRLILENAGSAS
jgi:antitoxin CptB